MNWKAAPRMLFASSFLLLVAGVATQAATPYLGQEPPGMEPIPFAPTLLASPSFAGTFSPDLTEFWFTEQDTSTRVGKVCGFALVGEEWQRVQTSPFDAVSDAMEPHIAPLGDCLFLTSVLRGQPTALVSERTDAGWGPAVALPAPINASGHFPMYISSTLDGTLYWTYLSSAGEAIVRTRKTGTGYGPVERMASDGMPWIGAHPFVSPDESLVIFDVRPQGTISDLVVVFRRADGTWTAPQPISAVNGAGPDEICASLSPDGRYLFFARDMRIWWVDAAVLGARANP